MSFTKAQLVAWVDARVHARFDQRFTEAALNDLIKDNLVPAAKRRGNAGRTPLYGFGWREAHRVLFLAALQGHGIRSRDAMRLRLFVAGCPLPIWEVRTALLDEFRRAAAVANAQTRTAYLDNRRPLTPSKLDSISREIGPADAVLRNAGLELSPAAVIKLIRGARQDRLQDATVSISGTALAGVLMGRESIDAIADSFGPMFAGLFLVGGTSDDQVDTPDSVEALIQSATEADLLQARSVLRGMCRSMNASAQVGIGLREGLDEAHMAMAHTIKRSPQFLAACLVIALRMVVAPPAVTTELSDRICEWLGDKPEQIAKLTSASSDAERDFEITRLLQQFLTKGDSPSSENG